MLEVVILVEVENKKSCTMQIELKTVDATNQLKLSSSSHETKKLVSCF